jgi:hypothetical protein
LPHAPAANTMMAFVAALEDVELFCTGVSVISTGAAAANRAHVRVHVHVRV